ncbi:putative membrane protein [Sphingomonas jinjuensis]|uniref:Putative membrane protein n=1 Tax=Sphingomonas jinjuensis TaxID=535907 RepID=A0A840F8B3_9SPHN|nr:NnrU family protein [Sphingomonas jinjuensis]MBB4152526.1 putative membrane protein [Sphingomonas jinjuensis]
MGQLIAACIAFVGTHFLLSHPLRAPLVARFGERGFLGLYSLVAFATLGWMAAAYRGAPATAPWWPVGDGLWAVVTAVMLIASVLLMGSLIGNPALPDPGGAAKPVPAARGVFAITRHPMMWAFALWGLCHIAVYPLLANVVLAGSIIVLALAGAALQDRKKEALEPERWRAWEAQTSFWPFAAVTAGRTRLGGFRPHDWAGGVLIWLAATWAHGPLAGWAAGIWRWI